MLHSARRIDKTRENDTLKHVETSTTKHNKARADSSATSSKSKVSHIIKFAITLGGGLVLTLKFLGRLARRCGLYVPFHHP
ncbi:hypothetical protein ACFX19_047756 [Malus domestica]